MNDKYQITSDGTIFEVMTDGSIKKIGHIANDGSVDSYKASVSKNSTNTSSTDSSISVVLAWLFAIVLTIVGIVCLNQNDKIVQLERSNNELQTKMENLEENNRSLSSNLQTLETENNNLKQNQPLRISSLEVGVTDSNNNTIVNYGNTIYSSQTQYLNPRISIYSYNSKTVKFYIKLYTPYGLSTGDSSPAGYSYTSENYVSSGNNTIVLGGWGNSTPGNWDRGNYRFEIWHNGICLKAHSFIIY